MKLLYVAPRYPPHVGGVEYVVKSTAERLAMRGHEVTVLCGEENIDSHREEWINSVHVIRWPVQAPGGAYHIPRMRGKLKKLLQDLAKGCDAVHFHSVLTMYSLSVLRGCGDRVAHNISLQS
ncbi:MAG: glycosyltransferase [Desulfurococcaceae archaeon]